MRNTAYPISLRIANIIYKRYYRLYEPFYFFYKKVKEKKEIELFTRVIKKGMTVLDIGGNIGFYAILFSRLTGETGTVHVFEPDALNFKHLKSNTAALKNVVVNNFAVGESTKTVRLYRSDELNVDHQTYDSGENRPYTEVECVSIDDYFRNNETVDLIKIDIQGYDYFALKGMEQTVLRSARAQIVGEFWPYGLHRAGVDPADYIILMETLGFAVIFGDREGRDYSDKIDDKFFYTNFYGKKSPGSDDRAG